MGHVLNQKLTYAANTNKSLLLGLLVHVAGSKVMYTEPQFYSKRTKGNT